MNRVIFNKTTFKGLSLQKVLLSFLMVIFFTYQFLYPALVGASSSSNTYALSPNGDQSYYDQFMSQFNQSPQERQKLANLPDPEPKTPDDYLILPYYRQLRNGQMTADQAVVLGALLSLPKWLLTTKARLNLYNFLNNHLTFIHNPKANPLWLFSIFQFWPLYVLILLVLLYFFIRVLISLFRKLLVVILRRFIEPVPPTFLELTFPSDTSKSSYATEQLYTLLHSLARRRTSLQGLVGEKIAYSLEIVSSRDEGIRYILVTPSKDAETIKRSLLSYLPGLKIKETNDYLPELKKPVEELNQESQEPEEQLEHKHTVKVSKTAKKKPEQEQMTDLTTPSFIESILELKLTNHFALSLKDHKALSEHDPIAFITGTMTKLSPGELISFQVITTPVLSSVHGYLHKEMVKLQAKIRKAEAISPLLFPGTLDQLKSLPLIGILVFLFMLSLKIIGKLLFLGLLLIASIPDLVFSKDASKTAPIFNMTGSEIKLPKVLDPYEEELHHQIKEKISQHLFETSIRILIVAENEVELESRISHVLASFGPFTSAYQSFTSKGRDFPFSLIPSFLVVSKLSSYLHNQKLAQFKNRTISPVSFFNPHQISQIFNHNPILSAPEISDVYHFPYTDLTKTEGLVKSTSKHLPAPLSMKKSDAKLDVIVGKNSYGDEDTPIGMSLEQRQRHSYVIGKTGMGKTEMLKNMIYQDMVSGKGLAVLDPHGDLFHELLGLVPKERIKDVVVFNPADKDYPVGLNILSSGIHFTDIEEGQDKIVSATLSVFQKITDDKYWGPRLEHILRNTAQTALFTPTPSFWIVQKLLTSSKDYQKEVAAKLKDPVLKQFWESEFALFGKLQQADATSPITNKVGKFITSHLSRNILLQPKSTFNIQEVMDSGKILLVNLSKGELGEDQSHFFGSLITSLIQLSAYERIHVLESQRRDFFLYVDEFQNFATHIFKQLSSEGRKWHVPLIPSHQNIAQIKDPNLLKIVAGNADTIICLKSGPDDEKFILPFMEPEVKKGAIVNLPPYHFYIKVTNKDSEDAFSGETELLDIEPSEQRAKEVIAHSRVHYGTPRKEVEKYLEKLFRAESTKGTINTKAIDPDDQPTPKSRKISDLKGQKTLKQRYV